jgi:putative autoinducer-2 (AI-2) aldolase
MKSKGDCFMPGPEAEKDKKDFRPHIPMKTEGFFLRGSASLDWGMSNRLARIFSPRSGRTVMLAFDHGYIMGPTTGLERMDLDIVRLEPHIDVLMCTRGALRSCIPPTTSKPVCLRLSAGATILKELSMEMVGDIEEAVRLNAAAVAVQCYVGEPGEHQTLSNLVRTVDAGNRVGMPTMGVTAVGKEMARDARYLGLATRVLAELGANFIKTYFCEPGFEDVVAGCPVPIVIAGGKKIPELEALKMARRAIDQGACGVDMGRNIFCAEDPVAMVQAVRAVVHENEKPQKAFDLYQTLKGEAKGKKKR